MATVLAILTLTAFIAAPNAALAAATLGRADADAHLAFGALAFIPWTLFGLAMAS